MALFRFIILCIITYLIIAPLAYAIDATVNYKFDQNIYFDVKGEVIDSIGSLHGQSQFSQPVEGKVCNAVDFTRTSNDDFIELPLNVLQNKDAFTISTWFKTLKGNGQAILSGGNGNSADNEVLLYMQSGTEFRLHRHGETINFVLDSADAVNDNEWHHLVWTHGSGQSCLYLDKVSKGCQAQPSTKINLSHLVLGQDLDSISVKSVTSPNSARQSSNKGSDFYDANLAIDGNTDGNYNNGSVSHTSAGPNASVLNQPWWQVRLDVQYDLSQIVIWNRTDCCASRLSNFYLIISEHDLAGKTLDQIKTLANSSDNIYTQEISSLNGADHIAIDLNNVYGRYVRIQLTSTDVPLHLAEVEVFGEKNIAKGQPTSMANTLNHYGYRWSHFAVDGNTYGRLTNNYSNESVASTNTNTPNAWWQVDLGLDTDTPSHNNISKIKIWNRTGCGTVCESRLSDFYVLVSDNDMSRQSLATLLADDSVYVKYIDTLNDKENIALSQGNVQGRYVKIQLAHRGTISIAEVQVFGTHIIDGFQAEQGFVGLLDELVIYDAVIDQNKVNEIYDYQNLGLDLDGTSLDCSTAVAQYHLEDKSWNGVTNEVTDSSINNFHGTTKSLATPTDFPDLNNNDIALTGDPGTCGSGDFKQDKSQYISIPYHEELNPNGSFSLSAWVKVEGGNNTYRTVLGSRWSMTDGDTRTGFMIYADSENKWAFWTGNGSNEWDRLTTDQTVNNEWTHIVVTFNSKYINSNGVHSGIKSIYINNRLVKQESNHLYSNNNINEMRIGASHSDNSNSTPHSYFYGKIDEVQVFPYPLSNDGVNQIYNERHPCPTPKPIASYHFEDGSWNGTADEVKDFSGNNINGTTISASTTPNMPNIKSVSPALISPSNPGTCNYSDFTQADKQAIEIANNPKLNQDGSFSVAAWVKVNSSEANFRSIVSSRYFTNINNGVGGGYAIYAGSNNKWQFWTHTNDGWNIQDSNIVIARGKWVHVAVTFRKTGIYDNDGAYSGTKSIYINGALVNSTTGYYKPNDKNSTLIGAGRYTAGTNVGATHYFFEGNIDEVQFFQRDLVQSEIELVMQQRHKCPPIDHYRIEHHGRVLTCEATSVNIKACANSDCSVLSSDEVNLDFQITSSTDGTSTVASPTFTGSTNISLDHTKKENLILSLANTSISASNPTVCSNPISGANCNLQLVDALLRFVYGPENENQIILQVAGNTFHRELKLQAQRSNEGACEGIFNGKVKIDLAQQNVRPTLTENIGLAFQINANENTAAGDNIAKYPAYTKDIELDFGPDSIAIIPAPRYLDAGKIRLFAKYSQAGVELKGSSYNFWVKPSTLELLAYNSDNVLLNSDSADSSITHAAGENFTFAVSALNSLGDRVQNYQQNHGRLQMRVKRILPKSTGSVDANFTYNSNKALRSSPVKRPTYYDVTLSSFFDGTKGLSLFTGAKFDEVGIINIDMQDTYYGMGGAGAGRFEGFIFAKDINIGRFTPDHFVVTPTAEGTLTHVNSLSRNYAYTGEMRTQSSTTQGAITYGIQPSILITPKNKANAITHNYIGDFMKLSTNNISIAAPTTDASQNGRDNSTKTTLTANINKLETNLIEKTTRSADYGTLLYKYSTQDNYVYRRNVNSLINQYTADIDLKINSITDNDSVPAYTNEEEKTFSLTLNPTGILIKFGRWNIENAYGPENSELPLPMSLQYWHDNKFITNTDDSYTVYDGSNTANKTIKSNDGLSPKLESTLVNVSDYRTSTAAPTFKTGLGNLRLSAPNKQGKIRVTYTDVPPWLRYNWDGVMNNNGDFYDDYPSGIAAFGIYRGNDRIILWEEVNKQP